MNSENNNISCNICNKSFKLGFQLTRHRERKHLDIKFECEFCNHEFNSKHDMQRHVNDTHTGIIRKCSWCEKEFDKYYRLKNHINKNHKEKIQVPENRKCKHCNYNAQSTSNLKIHIERTHFGKRERCDECNKECYSLKAHIRTWHSDRTFYNCDKCDFKCRVKSGIKQHFERKHLESKKNYPCALCGKVLSSVKDLRRHKRVLHNENAALFKCNFEDCKYSTNDKSKLTVHKKGVHQRANIECNFCEYKASFRSNYNRHMKTVHINEKNIKCSLCDKTFKIQSSLNVHLKFDHENFRHKCSLCDYKANRVGLIEIHKKKIHEGMSVAQKLFICENPSCDFKTVHRNSLKTHSARKHSDTSSRVECSVCKLSFALIDMKRHEAFHSKEITSSKSNVKRNNEKTITASFECESCQKIYKSKGALKEHFESVHQERELICELCPYQAPNNKIMKRHLQVHKEDRSSKPKYDSELCGKKLVWV